MGGWWSNGATGGALRRSATTSALSPVGSVEEFSVPTLPTDLAPEPIQYGVTEPVSTPTATIDAGPISLDQPTPAHSCCSWMMTSLGRGSPLVPNLHFDGWVDTV